MREVAEHINGFHRYLLSEDGKDHLIYAAASLGAMLGMEAAGACLRGEYLFGSGVSGRPATLYGISESPAQG